MTSSQDRRKSEKQLRQAGWKFLREGAKHTIYVGPNGTQFQLPRHRVTSPGVVDDMRKRMKEDEEK